MFLLATALAAPVADTPRGLYEQPFEVQVVGGGGSLLYSTDLSVPTLPVVGPIPIRTTTVLRLAEVAQDGSREETAHSYIFVADVMASSVMDQAVVQDQAYTASIERALRELPTISLVNPSGIPMTEVPISLEWIDPNGDQLQLGAGAYVSGGTSWAYEKTSFRLVFRDEYGPGHLEADIYGPDATGIPAVERFDVLSLRGGNHDTVFYQGARGQHLRNFWMDETQLDQGQLAPHGRFANVYRNGIYHGLYHVRERFNAAMMSEYLGGSEDDYEAITAGNAYDGSGAAWAALVAASGNFQEARRYLDVDDYLDYMILNYYAGNAWDWYSWHNWQAAGPARPDAGGFRFHSSDSDICLSYNWDVNILNLGGPSDVFLWLNAESDPDFRVALADAIYRNLSGPLSAEQAAARYQRLSELAYDGIAAESARWGYGWWRRDEEWITERDYLLYEWFPFRTDEMWRQFRRAGWYPLEAPTADLAAGRVAAGTSITIETPDGVEGKLYVRTDGGDPRESGGALATEAQGPASPQVLTAQHSMIVSARINWGTEWGPLLQRRYTVDEGSPLWLNEWNAVDPEDWLGGEEGDGRDLSLGRVQGNGGDWLELLVTEDMDLRGWRLVMEDRNGPAGELRFSEDPRLSDLKAGTILTIAEDMAEDSSYDPDGGDWRFHLRAGADGSGTLVSASTFSVTAAGWQLQIFDAEGFVRLGPVGEGISPRRGLSSKEVGQLSEVPTSATRANSPAYSPSENSSFGLPNEGQDLEMLRWGPGTVVEVDSGEWVDSGGDEDRGPATDSKKSSEKADSCGCGGGPAVAAWMLGLPLLWRRRRR